MSINRTSHYICSKVVGGEGVVVGGLLVICYVAYSVPIV